MPHYSRNAENRWLLMFPRDAGVYIYSCNYVQGIYRGAQCGYGKGGPSRGVESVRGQERERERESCGLTRDSARP